jgi:hypothetical protein
MFYNVELISPSCAHETHVALDAADIHEAIRLSPIMLTVNSPYQPEDFKVIAAYPTPLEQQPIKD